MGYDTPDTYNQPEKFGLEIVGSVSWDDEPYQFDFTVVWKDPVSGKMFYARDSGCSCPQPFEDYTSREELTPIENLQAFYDKMNQQIQQLQTDEYYTSAETRARVAADVAGLLPKVRAAWSAPSK